MDDTIHVSSDSPVFSGSYPTAGSGTLCTVDDVTHDDATGETVATFDPTREGYSHLVLDLVGLREGRELTDLDPLYGTIDPDDLDGLFADSGAGTDLAVSFNYEGYRVTVEPGAISVRPLE